MVLLCASGACDGDPTPPTPNGDQTAASLKVWAANLEHLLPEHDWTEFVDRVTEDGARPDLLFLSELTSTESDTVVDALRDATGTSYAFEHAPVGNNAVVWRTDRFGSQAEGSPLLWEPFGAAGCSQPSSDDPSQVVGVRLNDAQSGTAVVGVAVHWGRTWAAECMQKNMTSINEVIEGRWADRPLTIVAGDLNAHPDKQPVPGDPDAENLDSGRETDPDCWYRAFSALHNQQLEVARPDEDDLDCGDDPRYSAAADSYVDTVWVANRSAALCEQWTSVHGGPVAGGTSCTDLNEDGLRDRGRIDYIWARWESGGDVSIPSGSDAVVDAGADQVCILESCAATRYSDHRAVFAEIRVEPSG